MEVKTYCFDAEIKASEIGKGGAYVVCPIDLRVEYGKGRLFVHATFDNEPYEGSIVNMGVKDASGGVCYILGIKKEIREKIGKQIGDMVQVTARERER